MTSGCDPLLDMQAKHRCDEQPKTEHGFIGLVTFRLPSYIRYEVILAVARFFWSNQVTQMVDIRSSVAAMK